MSSKVPGTVRKSNLATRFAVKKQRTYFDLAPEFTDINTFLGKVEILEKESVVMTLAAPQGSGKSTAMFQLMNAFASSGYRCLHASLEEHPESDLYERKAVEYLSNKALQNIDAPAYSKNTIAQIWKDIEQNDVIFIDSMKKLWQWIKGVDLDNDFRKKFNGKLFVIIFQLTQDGKMKGGSDAAFDGDIISFIDKGARFEDNYMYHDKNRYNDKPLDTLKYNILHQKLMQDFSENTEVIQPQNLSYTVVE